jgi:hypothetical protein
MLSTGSREPRLISLNQELLGCACACALSDVGDIFPLSHLQPDCAFFNMALTFIWTILCRADKAVRGSLQLNVSYGTL